MKSLRELGAAWLGRSIGTRIATLSLLLLLLVQAANYTAIRASLGQHARSELPAQLRVAERVLQSLLMRNAQKLTEGARLLAADYGVRSAVQTGDVGTIASVLDNHGARIGATEAALLGTDFSLRAASGGNAKELALVTTRLAAKAAKAGAANEIALLGGRPHQVVLVPLKLPVLAGWVLMGFPLDPQLAGDMKDMSARNVTLLARTAAGAPWTAILTSLPAPQAVQLAQQAWDVPAEPNRVASGMKSVTIDHEEFGVRASWLTAPDSAAGGAVVALVSLSIDEAVRLPHDLQVGLLVITLLGFAVFVFVFGSLYTARRVSQPLRALAAAAERLGGWAAATAPQRCAACGVPTRSATWPPRSRPCARASATSRRRSSSWPTGTA